MHYNLKGLIVLSLMVLIGCTKINSTQMVQTMPQAPWGMAVFSNNTDVPQANFKAMSITTGVLRSKGIGIVAVYPNKEACGTLIVCPNASPGIEQVLHWGRRHNLAYVMTGNVNEWDYKVGMDGEPIAGISLQLYQVDSGIMIWSSVGSKIGTSRSGLSVIAQNLITEMLCTLR